MKGGGEGLLRELEWPCLLLSVGDVYLACGLVVIAAVLLYMFNPVLGSHRLCLFVSFPVLSPNTLIVLILLVFTRYSSCLVFGVFRP